MEKSNIKTIIKQGSKPGKNIVIMAGVHGNEVCGVKAFDDLIPKINIEKGKVTFIYANLEAYKQNKRQVEYNLNRCFLDNQLEEMQNTLEGKTAKEIIPYLKEADVLLDIHSSKTSDNLKFLICEEDCLDLIDSLTPNKVILGIDKVQKGGSDGYMFNHGKPGICVECGLHETEESLERAKHSILNFLKKVGAISGEAEKFPEKDIFRVDYMYNNKYGKFVLNKEFKDFEKVAKDALIGYDGNKEIYFEEEGYILFPYQPEEIGNECFVKLNKKSYNSLEK